MTDQIGVSRRRVLGTLGAAGTIALAGCGGGNGDGGDDGGDTPSDGGDGGTTTPSEVTFTVGAVQPLSGALQYYGQLSMWGFYTGLGYRAGTSSGLPEGGAGAGDYELEVGDTTYELLVRDSLGDSGEAQSQATDLVQSDDADVLFGATNSASALAIANNVAKEAEIPYMAGPAATVELTSSSENCSEYVFRASENVAMDALSGGSYIATETDIESVQIYYADYSFGRSVDQYYTKVLEANGVTVAGHTPLAPDYADDWPGQFEKATSAGVDAVIGGFTVAALPAMIGTYLSNDYDFRFVGGWTTMAGAEALGSVIQQNLDELTAEGIRSAGLGPLTTRYHWNQYDNDIASEANGIHRDVYGQNMDLFTGGVFAAASAFDQAVTQAGSTDADDLLGELSGMTVQDTLKGEGGYTFQEYNNQASSAMTVADPIPTTDDNSEDWNSVVQPGEPITVYEGEETTLTTDDESMTCSL